MPETIAIAAGNLRAEIVPSMGGGLARFDLVVGDKAVPIFRPWPEEGTEEPNQLACYPLVPWSNRISGGGFRFEDRFYEIAPTRPGDEHSLHGNGWLSPWEVTTAEPAHAVLSLTSEGPGPFRYDATLAYAIEADALTIRLGVTNRAEFPLPYGLGLHPWLPRSADALLMAPAKTVWLEDARHLPGERIPIGDKPDWDFSTPRPLPNGWINNGFAGWDGHALIEWLDRGVALAIEADERLRIYQLYSTGRDDATFCLEPVSHPVDAFNLPGNAEENGLVVLEPEEGFSVSCRFRPARIEAGGR